MKDIRQNPLIVVLAIAILFFVTGYRSGALDSFVFASVEWLLSGVVIIYGMIQLANRRSVQSRIGMTVVWMGMYLGLAIAKYIAGVTDIKEAFVHIVIGGIMFTFIYTSYKNLKS